MRRLLNACVILVLILINTLLLIGPLLLIALSKWLLPGKRLKAACTRGVMWVAQTWAEIDKLIFAAFTPTRWDIRGGANLRPDSSYLIVSNHQSWVDIPALVQAFNRKTPYFKFFLKQALIWVPFLGLAFWALDYPFMKRYSKAFLAKNPHLQGKDLAITRAACERFKNMPVSIVNFLEGTRFTPAKHASQASPYRHLLKPKAGGVAFVLATMGAQLDALLDVTLIYPDGKAPGFWALMSGQVPWVIIDIRSLPLGPALWAGDYQGDPQFRQYLQDWVGQLWQDKDERIERLRQEPITAFEKQR